MSQLIVLGYTMTYSVRNAEKGDVCLVNIVGNNKSFVSWASSRPNHERFMSTHTYLATAWTMGIIFCYLTVMVECCAIATVLICYS